MMVFKFCKKISRKSFMVAKSWLLISTIVLSSCDNTDEPMPVEEAEGDVTEYAFFDPSNPANVSICEAEDVACTFMRSDRGDMNTQKASTISYDIESAIVIPDDNMEPAMYVVNLEPDGFCIVSATKLRNPILAYYDEGKFDLENINEGIAEWLCEKIEEIQDIRNDSSYITPDITASIWHKYKVISDKRVYASTKKTTQTVLYSKGPLLSTTWRQCMPYNYYVPKECKDNGALYGNKAPTGCVSIAMAQVLKYFKYPSSKYEWNKMKDFYFYDKPIDAYAKSVAVLIRDIGEWLEENYDCGGSGSKTENMIDVFEKKFNYKSGGTFARLTESEAEPLVKNDIQNDRPVVMDGYKNKTTTGKLWRKKTKYTGGHCWVCDGYKQILYKTVTDNNENTAEYSVQRFYHMNWGWDINNGWFDFSDTGTLNGDYQYHRGYLTGIKAQ